MALYKGFSSFEFQRNKTFKINDINLVKMDLLNHIYTRKGERLMMPEFGTTIPEMVFEPLDAATLDIIQEELEAVFNYDPRVALVSLVVTPNYSTNTAIAAAKLLFIEFNNVDDFDLNLQFE